MSAVDRDRYADVGQAHRLSLERAMATPGIGRKSRVLLGVHYFTATWSRISDQVYLDQLADLVAIAGDSENRILRKYLRELHDEGSIVYSPAKGRRPGTIGLPRLEDEHQPPLMNVVSSGADLSRQKEQIRPASGTDLSPLPRRSPEKDPEGGKAAARGRAAADPAVEDPDFTELVAVIERLDGHPLTGEGRGCRSARARRRASRTQTCELER